MSAKKGQQTWYPQGHGRKFRSERSNSSMQRGLEHEQSETMSGAATAELRSSSKTSDDGNLPGIVLLIDKSVLWRHLDRILGRRAILSVALDEPRCASMLP